MGRRGLPTTSAGRPRRGLTIALIILVAMLSLSLDVTRSYASCVSGEPVPSPHAFVGTVVSTTAQGRVATVRTDGGTLVEVRGTTATAGATSVDRTYQVGGRYEFHPINDAAPFADNICTATHLLSMTPERLSGEAPYGRTLGLLAGLALLAVLAAVIVRHRLRS